MRSVHSGEDGESSARLLAGGSFAAAVMTSLNQLSALLIIGCSGVRLGSTSVQMSRVKPDLSPTWLSSEPLKNRPIAPSEASCAGYTP